MPFRVLLVEDVDELRATLRQALRLHGDFDVVADAANGVSGVTAATAHQPDVIVLDLGLPDLAGHELVAQMRQAAPTARIVVYTGSIIVDRADIRASVDAFVRKDHDIGYLVGLLADLGREHHQSADIQLGRNSSEMALARRFITQHCERWGCGAVIDDARLVVTELVSNALRHAGTTCELRARFAGGLLRIEVRDDGPGSPDVRMPGPTTSGGRGLLIVSALSQAWGVETLPGRGKIVWAELAVAAPAEPGGGASEAADGRRSKASDGDTGQPAASSPPVPSVGDECRTGSTATAARPRSSVVIRKRCRATPALRRLERAACPTRCAADEISCGVAAAVLRTEATSEAEASSASGVVIGSVLTFES